ncbi:DsbA family protein [Vagococcus fluvialis]|uniref:DsbA family protein n=1 Tax=Vagococcus fluvialis TaxID=2738 RepID=UPI003B5A913A
MIEIYLFINPIDESSLFIEKKFLNLINQEKVKVDFRMIPLLNPRVLQNFMIAKELPVHDLALRNHLFQATYSAALDYKTVQLQGKRLGHEFLIELQKQVGSNKKQYSTHLVESILEALHVDMELFQSDRRSELVVDFFKLDQQVAHEMGIEDYSNAVIFNYNCDRDFGVLIDANTPVDLIIDLFKTDCIENTLTQHSDRLHLY